MPEDSPRYRCMLYSCKADNHHHFIIGPENISWPFWSRDAGLRLADYSASAFCEDSDARECEEIRAQFDRLKREVEALSRVRNRNGRGEFANGFRMPREFLYHEGNVADFWGRFYRGEEQCMCYIAETLIGTLLLPLHCDFVRRKERDRALQLPLDRKQLGELAEEPAQIVTMEELGIVLQVA